MPNHRIPAKRKYEKRGVNLAALPFPETPENYQRLQAFYRAAWLMQDPDAGGQVIDHYQAHARQYFRNPVQSLDARFHRRRLGELERAFPVILADQALTVSFKL